MPAPGGRAAPPPSSCAGAPIASDGRVAPSPSPVHGPVPGGCVTPSHDTVQVPTPGGCETPPPIDDVPAAVKLPPRRPPLPTFDINDEQAPLSSCDIDTLLSAVGDSDRPHTAVLPARCFFDVITGRVSASSVTRRINHRIQLHGFALLPVLVGASFTKPGHWVLAVCLPQGKAEIFDPSPDARTRGAIIYGLRRLGLAARFVSGLSRQPAGTQECGLHIVVAIATVLLRGPASLDTAAPPPIISLSALRPLAADVVRERSSAPNLSQLSSWLRATALAPIGAGPKQVMVVDDFDSFTACDSVGLAREVLAIMEAELQTAGKYVSYRTLGMAADLIMEEHAKNCACRSAVKVYDVAAARLPDTVGTPILTLKPVLPRFSTATTRTTGHYVLAVRRPSNWHEVEIYDSLPSHYPAVRDTWTAHCFDVDVSAIRATTADDNGYNDCCFRVLDRMSVEIAALCDKGCTVSSWRERSDVMPRVIARQQQLIAEMTSGSPIAQAEMAGSAATEKIEVAAAKAPFTSRALRRILRDLTPGDLLEIELHHKELEATWVARLVRRPSPGLPAQVDYIGSRCEECGGYHPLDDEEQNAFKSTDIPFLGTEYFSLSAFHGALTTSCPPANLTIPNTGVDQCGHDDTASGTKLAEREERKSWRSHDPYGWNPFSTSNIPPNAPAQEKDTPVNIPDATPNPHEAIDFPSVRRILRNVRRGACIHVTWEKEGETGEWAGILQSEGTFGEPATVSFFAEHCARCGEWHDLEVAVFRACPLPQPGFAYTAVVEGQVMDTVPECEDDLGLPECTIPARAPINDSERLGLRESDLCLPPLAAKGTVTGRTCRLWHVHSGRPPGVHNLTWAAVSEPYRSRQQYWLRRLSAMPGDLLNAPIAAAAVEVVLRERLRKRWQAWSTVSSALSTIAAATDALPILTSEKAGINLRADPIFAAALRRAAHLARVEHEAPTDTFPSSAFASLLASLRSPSARLLAEWTWLAACRVGDLRQVRTRDVTLTDNGDRWRVAATVRKGKGAAFWGPFCIAVVCDESFGKRLAAHVREVGDNEVFSVEDQRTLARALAERGSGILGFRRGAIISLAERGIKDEDLQLITGHRRRDTLLRYLGWGVASASKFSAAEKAFSARQDKELPTTPSRASVTEKAPATATAGFSDDTRCSGITKTGARCSDRVVSQGRLCPRHEYGYDPDPSAPVCGAPVRNGPNAGRRCGTTCAPGYTLCCRHLGLLRPPPPPRPQGSPRVDPPVTGGASDGLADGLPTRIGSPVGPWSGYAGERGRRVLKPPTLFGKPPSSYELGINGTDAAESWSLHTKPVAPLSLDECLKLAQGTPLHERLTKARSFLSDEASCGPTQAVKLRRAYFSREDMEQMLRDGKIERFNGEARGTVNAFWVAEAKKRRRRPIFEPLVNRVNKRDSIPELAYPSRLERQRRCKTKFAIQFDFASYFDQFVIDEALRPFFVFVVGNDRFCCRTMPMGANFAPSVAQHVTWSLVAGIDGEEVDVSTMIDNVRITADTELAFVKAVRTFLSRARAAGASFGAVDGATDTRSPYDWSDDELAAFGRAAVARPFEFLGEEMVVGPDSVKRFRNTARTLAKVAAAWNFVGGYHKGVDHDMKRDTRPPTLRNAASLVSLLVFALGTHGYPLAKAYRTLRFFSTVSREAAHKGWDSRLAFIAQPILDEMEHLVSLVLRNEPTAPFRPRPHDEVLFLVSDACASGFGVITFADGDHFDGCVEYAGDWGNAVVIPHSTESEPRAVMEGLKFLRNCRNLERARVVVVTDHQPLFWAQRNPVTGLQGFSACYHANRMLGLLHDLCADYEVKYIAGENNPADFLSRTARGPATAKTARRHVSLSLCRSRNFTSKRLSFQV